MCVSFTTSLPEKRTSIRVIITIPKSKGVLLCIDAYAYVELARTSRQASRLPRRPRPRATHRRRRRRTALLQGGTAIIVGVTRRTRASTPVEPRALDRQQQQQFRQSASPASASRYRNRQPRHHQQHHANRTVQPNPAPDSLHAPRNIPIRTARLPRRVPSAPAPAPAHVHVHIHIHPPTIQHNPALALQHITTDHSTARNSAPARGGVRTRPAARGARRALGDAVRAGEYDGGDGAAGARRGRGET